MLLSYGLNKMVVKSGKILIHFFDFGAYNTNHPQKGNIKRGFAVNRKSIFKIIKNISK